MNQLIKSVENTKKKANGYDPAKEITFVYFLKAQQTELNVNQQYRNIFATTLID